MNSRFPMFARSPLLAAKLFPAKLFPAELLAFGFLAAGLLATTPGQAAAQSRPSPESPAPSIGTVAAEDATVTNALGGITVTAGRLLLAGSSTVTAKDRTAEVTLARGGAVRICQTSGLHLTASGADVNDASLLLALDRGALEINMKAHAADVLLTPDLRFTLDSGGPLDLRLRVSRNGDTCVENRGRNAPILKITDAFGEATYFVNAGQHVLFEHGNLREVVDRETTPCGCPPEERPGISIAEAVLQQPGAGPVSPSQAESAHPFPQAVSDGLARPAPRTPEAPGGTHVQVATALTYNPSSPVSPSPVSPAPISPNSVSPKAVPAAPPPPSGKPSPPAAEPVTSSAALPLPAPQKQGSRPAVLTTTSAPISAAQPSANKQRGPFRAIGRFFKSIFVR